MRVLMVFAHPGRESYGAALFATARESLLRAGHEVEVIDLYAEGFDPVLTAEDWADYLSDTDRLIAKLDRHVSALRRAEALVMVYPTWMYGPPAILKGWMERVWLPGVAFEVASATKKRATGRLQNIRHLAVITTSGSPWWWLRLIRDPGRSMLTRGYRVLFHPRCRITWLQLHDMNHRKPKDLKAFLAKVDRRLSRLGGEKNRGRGDECRKSEA
ncbi:NAD(P)H-dependent oxidoreductase [Salipiger sp. PrR002]|uniref:NAD(P)H-dependent oxidoreductase n=1 Tax=Salipiger sp. PrR002 TaxID=2706489 RepID=UPI0013BC6358|nr:NAD(P)H-dependent oxidoreductase [Salipiger sp. PrR002]NDW00996.1 NAD(P)H-dependent oxidoreductase [Salipiger sp. PrR002]NDW56543.1 NAD(P)H-dependent oxidoreductase [Salipiger sp. PrR004]